MKKGYQTIGKRWFQRTYGNTYHSCRVIETSGTGKGYTRKEIGYVPFTYGYDDQYLTTAMEILQSAGIFPKTGEHHENGFSKDYSAFMKWLRDNPESISYCAIDVNRKKDL